MSLNMQDLELQPSTDASTAPAAAPKVKPSKVCAGPAAPGALNPEAHPITQVKLEHPETGVVAKKKRRFKSGAFALLEIKKYQRSDKPVVPRAPLKRLCLEILHELYPDFRMSSVAVDALRDIAESEITKDFALAMDLAINIGHRKTLDATTFRIAANINHNPEALAAGGSKSGSLAALSAA